MAQPRVSVYTDGGCQPNPGPGGWAAILRFPDREQVLTGGSRDTTNNRMELSAAINALQSLSAPHEVHLYTDSQYVHNGITAWLPAWVARGWKRSGRKPVLNEDLWKQLAALAGRHKVHWHWLRGHSGHPLNARADRLAREATQRFAGRRRGGA